MQVHNLKVWNDWLWAFLGMATALPGVLIGIYKIRQRLLGKELLRTGTTTTVDWAFRIIFGYCFVYYFIDALSIILLSRITMVCYQAYFLHHITSIMGLRHIFTTEKPIFWFEVLPAAMHSVVLAVPSLPILQFVYFGTLITWIAMLYVSPYCNYNHCRRVYKYQAPVVIALIMAWYFDCLHLMDAVNAARSDMPGAAVSHN